MVITGDQIRMARAALRLTVREVAELTGVDKSTIVRIEAGGKAYYQNMLKLQTVFEDAGVVFLSPVEGDHGLGVAFKWGVDTAKIKKPQGEARSSSDDGLSSRAWDEEPDDATLPPDIIEQRQYWRAHPERWAKLSAISKFALAKTLRL